MRLTRPSLLLTLLVAVATAISGCGGRQPTSYHRSASTVHRTPIGANDVFRVRVMGEEELTQEFRVQGDGTVDYPYLGTLHVAGREAAEVATEIRDGLRTHQILNNPQVSVMVTAVNSRRVSVLGQVQHPGMQEYVQGMDVIMAISAAGGFTAIANRGAVRVTRRAANNTTRVFVIHADDIVENRADNFDIEPGDIIFVPESLT